MAQLHLAPPDATADELRRQAAKQGISLNAYLTPFLNDLAEGRITRVYHCPPPPRELGKAA